MGCKRANHESWLNYLPADATKPYVYRNSGFEKPATGTSRAQISDHDYWHVQAVADVANYGILPV